MLEQFISNLDSSLKERITIVYNPDFDLANGRSLYKAKSWVEKNGISNFFYTMVDHFFSERFMKEAMLASYSETVLSLVVDKPSQSNIHIDLDDVTRVKSNKGLIQLIGKHLNEYDYFDTGLFHAWSTLFDYLENSIRADKDNISDTVQLLTETKQVSVKEVSGYFWNDIDTPEDLEFMRSLMANSQTLRGSL